MRCATAARATALLLAVVVGAVPRAAAEQPLDGKVGIQRQCAEAAEKSQPMANLPFAARALRERHKIVVLAIGASPLNERDQLEGHYARVEQVLESSFKGLDVKIVDRGVSGEMVRDGAERIRNEVALIKPDLVFWQVGVADALALTPAEDLKRTLNETINWLRKNEVDIVLIGLRYQRKLARSTSYQQVRQAIREVVREQAILRIGHYESIEAMDRIRRAHDEPTSELDLTDAGSICLADFLSRALAVGLFARPVGGEQPGPQQQPRSDDPPPIAPR